MKRTWKDYMWVVSLAYLILGFFHILFAWLGLLCFFIPLVLAISKKGKVYCHSYCGRGQLFQVLAKKLHLPVSRKVPRWISSPLFRYGFLLFFLIMFLNMIMVTYLVFQTASNLHTVVTLLWTIRLPWQWVQLSSSIPAWIYQFAFGFYSIMLTSTILGLVTMLLYRPRTWCVYCPMGTMTQLIAKGHQKKLFKGN